MLRAITIRNLSIQFDADQNTTGSDMEQARQAIELINGVLQREPFGLAAQIMPDIMVPAQVSSQPIDDEAQLAELESE